jgi:hypothetical protein
MAKVFIFLRNVPKISGYAQTCIWQVADNCLILHLKSVCPEILSITPKAGTVLANKQQVHVYSMDFVERQSKGKAAHKSIPPRALFVLAEKRGKKDEKVTNVFIRGFLSVWFGHKCPGDTVWF